MGTYTWKENIVENALKISNLWLESNGLVKMLSCMPPGFSSCVCISIHPRVLYASLSSVCV